MKEDSTKAMQEALQAALQRMNGSAGAAPSGAPDLIGLVMTVLSKVMENNEGREDLVEKIDGLKQEEFGPVREQLRVLRKQVVLLRKEQLAMQERQLKQHEELLIQLRELHKQQNTVGHAVLDLSEQMARVELVDEIPDDEFDEEAHPVSTRVNGGAREEARMRERSARK